MESKTNQHRPRMKELLRLPVVSMLPQVARLRGGVKRATVKADEEDDGDDAEEDEEDAGRGPVSALTGVFKNVRVSPILRLHCRDGK